MGNNQNRAKNTFAKECMLLALKRLLHEKSIEDITISELVEMAGISRTTFYRNYHSITDILADYYEMHPFGAMTAESYTPEKFDLPGRLRDSFESMLADKPMFMSLISSGMENLIYENYNRGIKTICRNRAFDIGFRTEYELTAFVGMYYAICYEWIKGGMKEDVDTMVDISYRIIHTFYKKDTQAKPERDDVYKPLIHE